MWSKLIPIFIIIPLIELTILIEVGRYIGTADTILLVLVTGVLGIYLTKWQGFIIWRKVREELSRLHLPTDEMIEGVLIFAGGILLLTPGILTDLLGFLLILPWTRILFREKIKNKFKQRIKRKIIEIR